MELERDKQFKTRVTVYKARLYPNKVLLEMENSQSLVNVALGVREIDDLCVMLQYYKNEVTNGTGG